MACGGEEEESVATNKAYPKSNKDSSIKDLKREANSLSRGTKQASARGCNFRGGPSKTTPTNNLILLNLRKWHADVALHWNEVCGSCWSCLSPTGDARSVTRAWESAHFS